MRVFRVSSVFLVVLAALLSGCSWFSRDKGNPLDTLPVEGLYQRGVESLDNRSWGNAARAFERLIARFPFGPYTEQATINLAYVQYKDFKPEDAYSTINRFIKTYPTHRHIDYAYYLRGLINFNRSAGFLERFVGQNMTKRDQGNVRQSFDDFGALVSRYPNSRYADDARQRMIYLRNGMAQSELNIAHYYLKRGAYVAASNRAKAIIETYPQSPQVADALALMMTAYARLGQDQLASDARRVLELNAPQHPALSDDRWPRYPSNWWRLVPLMDRGQ